MRETVITNALTVLIVAAGVFIGMTASAPLWGYLTAIGDEAAVNDIYEGAEQEVYQTLLDAGFGQAPVCGEDL